MDITKFVFLNLRTNHLSPYYVKDDEWNEHPLVQVRLMRVAGAWEIRLYDSTTIEFATLMVEDDKQDGQSHYSLLTALDSFDGLRVVNSRDQIESHGFIVNRVI